MTENLLIELDAYYMKRYGHPRKPFDMSHVDHRIYNSTLLKDLLVVWDLEIAMKVAWSRRKLLRCEYLEEPNWIEWLIEKLNTKYDNHDNRMYYLTYLYDLQEANHSTTSLLIMFNTIDIKLYHRLGFKVAPKAHIYSDIQIICLED